MPKNSVHSRVRTWMQIFLRTVLFTLLRVLWVTCKIIDQSLNFSVSEKLLYVCAPEEVKVALQETYTCVCSHSCSSCPRRFSSSPGRTPRWEPSWVSELCNLADSSSSPRWVGLYSFSDHEAISRLTRIGTCTHPDMEHTYRVGLVLLHYSVGYECWGGRRMWGKKGMESNSPATVGPLH